MGPEQRAKSTRARGWIRLGLALGVSLLCSVVGHSGLNWSFGSPQQVLLAFSSFVLFWFVANLLLDRGQIALRSLFGLLTICCVGMGLASWRGHSIRQQDLVLQRIRGEGGSCTTEPGYKVDGSGWVTVADWLILPNRGCRSSLDSTFRGHSITINAASITMENLRPLRWHPALKRHLIVLSDGDRSIEGLNYLCDRLHGDELHVQAERLTGIDVEYLESVRMKKQIKLTLIRPNEHSLRMLPDLRLEQLAMHQMRRTDVLNLGSALDTIRTLTIRDSDCSAELFERIDQRASKMELTLESCSLRPDAWRTLLGMKHIDSLTLNRCNLGESDLAAIAGNAALRNLRIEYNSEWICDPGIHFLGEAKSIETLYLQGKFTLEGMKRLRSLGGLRSLKAFSPALPDGQLDLEGADLQAVLNQD